MTDREKQSLKIRLGRRLSTDRRGVMEIVKEEIDKTPTVEKPQGKWIKHIDDIWPEDSTQECPFCHQEERLLANDNFCPNCGAKLTMI